MQDWHRDRGSGYDVHTGRQDGIERHGYQVCGKYGRVAAEFRFEQGCGISEEATYIELSRF